MSGGEKMPESHTEGVKNSDIKRKIDTEKRLGIPNYREYTIVTILLIVWKQRRYGRNDYVDAYIMTHFRKVLDEIERLHSRGSEEEDAVLEANRLFNRELHRMFDRINWIYE